MPRFTEDFFTRCIPHWEALFFGELAWDPERPRRVVEIGSFEGGPLDALVPRTERLHERFLANLEESGQAHKAKVLRMDSFAGITRLLASGARADLVYVDGSHEAPDVLADLVLAFRLLPPGGVILYDDYLWSREETPRADILGCPKLGIDAFTNIHRRQIDPLEWGYAWQQAFRRRSAR
jgi:hypothetical protein